MMKTVENTVEKLRLTTQSRLDQLQVECAPFLANDFVRIEENIYGYMNKGQLTRLSVEDDFRVFKVNGLRFIYKTKSKVPYSRRDWLKNMVDDKSKYTDWANRSDIKAELQMDLILILAEHGYPPVPQDEVFKEIFEQAENFKKYEVEAAYISSNVDDSKVVPMYPQMEGFSDIAAEEQQD